MIKEGQQIGSWLVLKQVKLEGKAGYHYLCRCSCNKEQLIRSDTLTQRRSTKCLDCRKLQFHNPSDFIGKKFNDWSIIGAFHNKNRQLQLICECKCGIKLNKPPHQLLYTKRCQKCDKTIHGMEATPTYNTWRTMKARCLEPKHHNYKHYGARGIKICERWLNFANFFSDMGEKPIGYQIDRINNDGNYEPGNCRWVTPKENSNNRRPRQPVTERHNFVTKRHELKSKELNEETTFTQLDLPFNETNGQ